MTFDYVILGGGLYGSLCAHLLSNNGYKVAIIDGDSPVSTYGDFWSYESKNYYEWKRYRKLGGKSLHWGGNICLPTDNDLKYLFKQTPRRCSLLDRILGCDDQDLRVNDQYRKRIQTKISVEKLRENVELIAGRYIHRFIMNDQLASSIELYNIKNNTIENIHAKNFILSCSPYENTNILKSTGYDDLPVGIGVGFNDHYVCSYIVVTDNFETKYSDFKFADGALYELTGPFSVCSLSDNERVQMNLIDNNLDYYMVHGFIKSDNGHRRIMNNSFENEAGFARPNIDWSLSDLDSQNIMNLEEKLQTEIERLFGDSAVDIFQTNDPYKSQSIAHEVGGIALDICCDDNLKVNNFDNVFVGDASFLRDALEVYPTYSVMWKLLSVFTRL